MPRRALEFGLDLPRRYRGYETCYVEELNLKFNIPECCKDDLTSWSPTGLKSFV